MGVQQSNLQEICKTKQNVDMFDEIVRKWAKMKPRNVKSENIISFFDEIARKWTKMTPGDVKS